MQTLDRSAIREELTVGALVVPARRTGEFLARLRPHLLNVARTRNVASGVSADSKKLLLARQVGRGLPKLERCHSFSIDELMRK